MHVPLLPASTLITALRGTNMLAKAVSANPAAGRQIRNRNARTARSLLVHPGGRALADRMTVVVLAVVDASQTSQKISMRSRSLVPHRPRRRRRMGVDRPQQIVFPTSFVIGQQVRGLYTAVRNVRTTPETISHGRGYVTVRPPPNRTRRSTCSVDRRACLRDAHASTQS